MDLDVGCSFVFEVPTETHAVMLFEPHSSEIDNITSSQLTVTQGGQELQSKLYRDGLGNRCRRITFAAGPAEVHYSARAEISCWPDDTVESAALAAPAELADDVLQYL